MKKTSNYSLNQWEATDRIMREDFNTDNTNIDAVLKSLKESNPYVLLRTITTTADAQQVDLDISDIDWSVYRHLILHMNLESRSGYAEHIIIRLNGISGDLDYNYSHGGNISGSVGNWGDFYTSGLTAGTPVKRQTTLKITGGMTYPECDISTSETSVSKYYFTCIDSAKDPMATINLYMSDTNEKIKAGSSVTIYGVRI